MKNSYFLINKVKRVTDSIQDRCALEAERLHDTQKEISRLMEEREKIDRKMALEIEGYNNSVASITGQQVLISKLITTEMQVLAGEISTCRLLDMLPEEDALDLAAKMDVGDYVGVSARSTLPATDTPAEDQTVR